MGAIVSVHRIMSRRCGSCMLAYVRGNDEMNFGNQDNLIV